MTTKKPTIQTTKKLLGGGWSGFKHRLMKHLEIPLNQYDNWDVPEGWKYCFKRASGWSHADTVKQLKNGKL